MRRGRGAIPDSSSNQMMSPAFDISPKYRHLINVTPTDCLNRANENPSRVPYHIEYRSASKGEGPASNNETLESERAEVAESLPMLPQIQHTTPSSIENEESHKELEDMDIIQTAETLPDEQESELGILQKRTNQQQRVMMRDHPLS